MHRLLTGSRFALIVLLGVSTCVISHSASATHAHEVADPNNDSKPADFDALIEMIRNMKPIDWEAAERAHGIGWKAADRVHGNEPAPMPSDDGFVPTEPVDPFGGGIDPFAGPADRTPKGRPGFDPVGGDPFGDPADPFGAADPFGGAADPFADPKPAVAKKRPPAAPEQFATLPRYEQTDADIEAALAKRAEIEFIRTPLAHAVEILSGQYRINIDVDRRALQDIGVDGGAKIDLHMQKASLATALELMLSQLGLTYVVRDGALVITAPQVGDDKVTTEVYPVHDLLVSIDPDAGLLKLAGLTDVLQATIDRKSWDQAGGEGAIAPVGATIVVQQTWRGHRKVRQFLAALRQVRQQLIVAQGGPPKSTFVPLKPLNETIAKALAENTTLEFIETPLQDVVDYLKDLHGVEIQIDRRAIEDTGIGSDTGITRNVKGIPLGSALCLMLRDLDLAYTVRNDMVLITTGEQVESLLTTRIYPIVDLVPPLQQDETLVEFDNPVIADYDPLIGIITGNIQSSLWHNIGGPCEVEPLDGALVIRATDEIHDEVVALLEALRKVHVADKQRPLKSPIALESERHAKLREILETKLPEIEFEETPLDDVVDALKDELSVEIQIDHRALEDVGIGSDSPVTARVGGETLRVAMRRILKEFDLRMIIGDDVLFITSPDEVESHLVVKLYDVRGLIPADDGLESRHRRGNDYAFCHMIVETVQNRTWESYGGSGALNVEPHANVLVAGQTDEIHEQIAPLIGQLHLAQLGQKTPTPAEIVRQGVLKSDVTKNQAGEKVFLKIYRVKSTPADAANLQKIVRDLIASKTWDADDAHYLQSLSTALVVRHTAATHRQLHKLLQQLDVLDESDQGKQPYPGRFSAPNW